MSVTLDKTKLIDAAKAAIDAAKAAIAGHEKADQEYQQAVAALSAPRPAVPHGCHGGRCQVTDWPGDNVIDRTTEFARLAELPEGIGFADTETRQLRVRLAAEEYREYLAGERATIEGPDDVIIWGEADRVEVCDGAADQIVIAWGTLLTYVGEECATEILREVWDSNLAKVDGRHGPIVRRGDGKLLKPEGWQPPDVAGVLRRHGFLDPGAGE